MFPENDFFEIMMQAEEDGVVSVVCQDCGTEHVLEPDGETVCGRVSLVRSPLLDAGMI